jgi:hypothetical protein
MFGFARARPEMLAPEERIDLRRFYCGLCDALRRDYGPPYAALTGWDGRFIALTIGAQALHEETHAATRCPARLGTRSLSMVPYGIAARYAAAVTVFLLGEKLDDDLHDEHSKRARLAKPLTHKQVARAVGVLRELDFPLAEAMSLRESQRAVESGRQAYALQEVTQPPAEATALILGHTAVLAGTPENGPALREVGRSVGRIVTLLDACYDFPKDAKSGVFNAVAETAGSHKPIRSISGTRFEQTADYLIEQLREIRQAHSRLVLHRHASIVQNILFMGLFDATTNATRRLALCVRDPVSDRGKEWWCSTCGAPARSRFCPSCGKGPYEIAEGKEAK